MEDFIAGYNCRRVIMDRVMDGRMDRVQCEEGEEACDVCQRNREDMQFNGSQEGFQHCKKMN